MIMLQWSVMYGAVDLLVLYLITILCHLRPKYVIKSEHGRMNLLDEVESMAADIRLTCS